MPKHPIRERMLSTRRHCSAETCLHLSLSIQERLLGSEFYRAARTVGLYCPIQNEVHTELLARRCLADAKQLFYPRVSGNDLDFVEVKSLAELAPGAFGILEPRGKSPVPISAIDLLVVPGVAFDLHGHRLGYGRGYYDQALAGCSQDLERVGLAYEFQLVDRLPVDGHDCRLTGLVTEQRMLCFHHEAGR